MHSQGNSDTKDSLLKHLFETSLAGIALFKAIKNSDGRIDDFICTQTSVNFETLTGLNSQDMLNKPLSMLLPKEKQSSMLFVLAEVLRVGEAKVFEHFFPWLKRWFEVNAFRVDEDVVAAIFSDVTRRKELEAEVQRRIHYEDLLSSISLLAVEQADLNVFLQKCVDKLGNVVELSRVYLFEHNFVTACVNNTHEWCAHDIEPQIENLQEIPAQNLEWWTRTLEKDGLISFSDVNDIPDKFTRETLQAQKIISILVVPLFVNGQYFGFIGFDDCVNYKTWPDEDVRLLLSISRIMSSVIERDRNSRQQASLRAQLIQSQKMESIGRLAGGVAHDFNNMLNVILGHTEMAIEDIAPESSVVYNLNEIKEAAMHSAQLTQQLLGFARKQAVAPKVIDLNETIRSMLNMLKRLIGENVVLSFRAGEGLKAVKIDPVQVDQILANLCVNSRDAISELGSISIETRNVVLDSSYCLNHIGFIAGEFVQIAVSDNGCGMDAKTKNSIFEPFFTTKAQGKGTGLGLATVYGIVKQNQGFINVYSEEGIGSVFTIYLPANDGIMLQQPAELHPISHCQGKERILLVEDETAILNMMKRMLQRMGYSTISTSSPSEAIKLAKESTEKIDLLISDIIMPEMNGKDLAERIKRIYPEMRVLFMSGYTADVIAHHGILDEGVCFMQKPFTRDQLAEKLKVALEKQPG
jgi:PAS domain S-box-containing protein